MSNKRTKSSGKQPSSSSPTKKSKKEPGSDAGQTDLLSFFSSPNGRARSNGPRQAKIDDIFEVSPSPSPTGKAEKKVEVIMIEDEDEESGAPGESDIEMLSQEAAVRPNPDGDDGYEGLTRAIEESLRPPHADALVPEAGPSGSSKSMEEPPLFLEDSPPPRTDIAGVPFSKPEPSVAPSFGPVLFGNGKGKAKEAPQESVVYPDLGVDPLEFSPSCPWKQGSPAPYSFLAYVLGCISQTRSRILILNILTNSLRILIAFDPLALLPSVYILSNSLTPPHVPLELNLGPAILSKALQQVSGLSSASLRQLYNSLGDPGDVAFAAKTSVRTLIPHPPLMVKGVYSSLITIANSKGQGAAKAKQSIVEKLLLSAQGEEVRYLVRTLSMHLRVGAVRTTILTGLARASVLTWPPEPCPPPKDDSLYFASPKLLSQVESTLR